VERRVEALEGELDDVMARTRVKAYASSDELVELVRDLESEVSRLQDELDTQAGLKQVLCFSCQRLVEPDYGDGSSKRLLLAAGFDSEAAVNEHGASVPVRPRGSVYASGKASSTDFMVKMERAIGRIDQVERSQPRRTSRTPSPGSSDASGQRAVTFEGIDTNHDGVIDRSEFQRFTAQ